MPGPPRWRQPLLVLQNLSTQKVLQQTIDERVSTLLTFIQQQARRNPEVVFGDGVERTRDTPENRAFCRKLATEGMVLLKNNKGVLPLAADKIKRVAVIGPNAKERVVSGGGSAALKPSYVVSPWDGITQNAPVGIEFTHHIGCYGMPHQLHTIVVGYILTLWPPSSQVSPNVGEQSHHAKRQIWLVVYILCSR